jgi:hypothetical protein
MAGESESREEKGLVRIVRGAVLHPIVLGGVAAVVVGLAVWWRSGARDHGPTRWEGGGWATETDWFRALVKLPEAGPSVRLLGFFDAAAEIKTRVTDWSRPHVAIYSVPAPTPSQPLPNLRDLGETGQAHAIDFLARYPTREKQTLAELQVALRDKKDSIPGEKDPFRFDRILVASVAKGTDWNPGDRMMWTRVFVEPINFSFAGYTVAATENKQVKVTSVEATNTKKISAEIGLAIPELEGSKVNLSPSDERTVKTTSDVTAQYENLGIDITPQFLKITRESEIGGNAIGNTLISLSVVTDPTVIQRRYPREIDDAEKRRSLEDVVLQVMGVHLEDENGELDKDHASITVMPQTPIPHCALRARIWMLYEERQIDEGGQYYEEARQTVKFLRDADQPRDVDFINPDDVSPAVWSIKLVENEATKLAENEATKKQKKNGKNDATPPQPNVDKNQATQVLGAHIKNGSDVGASRELVFTDYAQASKLAHWIRGHKEHQIRHLIFDYDGRYSLVPVKKTHDECKPDYNPNSRVVYKTAAKPQ